MAKKYYYLKDDKALEEFRNNNKNKNYLVQRFKGLGELSPDETEETLLDPENRILHQVTISDVKEADKLFDDLMGTAVIPRKIFIKEHSKEASGNDA